MTDGGDDLGDYVRKVQQNTQEYLRDLSAENAKLCALIHTLEGELDRERKDRLRIEERVAAIDAERRSYLERYLEVEAQNANVSNLYVATLRVHGSIGRSDVLAAVHEIVINLVGCEELAVLEMNSDGSALVLSSSFGIDPVRISGSRSVRASSALAQSRGVPISGMSPRTALDPRSNSTSPPAFR